MILMFSDLLRNFEVSRFRKMKRSLSDDWNERVFGDVGMILSFWVVLRRRCGDLRCSWFEGFGV